MKFFRRFSCKHHWKLFRIIHGDERLYATREYRCEKCGKHQYSGGDYKGLKL